MIVSLGGGQMPDGDLHNMIKAQFGSLEALQTQLSTASAAVQGSGWGWLGYDKVGKRLAITACANQDPLQASTGLVPILGIDVWEHAYYLQYKNVRPDYLKAIWKVVNWKDCAERLAEAKK
jgi:superoxide dismutase, Fe-Mn family